MKSPRVFLTCYYCFIIWNLIASRNLSKRLGQTRLLAQNSQGCSISQPLYPLFRHIKPDGVTHTKRVEGGQILVRKGPPTPNTLPHPSLLVIFPNSLISGQVQGRGEQSKIECAILKIRLKYWIWKTFIFLTFCKFIGCTVAH